VISSHNFSLEEYLLVLDYGALVALVLIGVGKVGQYQSQQQFKIDVAMG
jgi:hypothetical protein